MRDAIAGDAPAEDVVTALPLLLKAGVEAGPPASMPCPAGFVCQPDDVVFGAYVAYTDRSSGAGEDVVAALAALVALADPRLVPLFVRLSLGPAGPVRQTALDALVKVVLTGPEPRARARLLTALTQNPA